MQLGYQLEVELAPTWNNPGFNNYDLHVFLSCITTLHYTVVSLIGRGGGGGDSHCRVRIPMDEAKRGQ